MKRTELKVGEVYRVGVGKYSHTLGVLLSTDVYEQPTHFRYITDQAPSAVKVKPGEKKGVGRQHGLPVLVIDYPSADQIAAAREFKIFETFSLYDTVQVAGRGWRIKLVQPQQIVQQYDAYQKERAEKAAAEQKHQEERESRENLSEANVALLNTLVPGLGAWVFNAGQSVRFEASQLSALIAAVEGGG